jgi:hypothetical protein
MAAKLPPPNPESVFVVVSYRLSARQAGGRKWHTNGCGLPHQVSVLGSEPIRRVDQIREGSFDGKNFPAGFPHGFNGFGVLTFEFGDFCGGQLALLWGNVTDRRCECINIECAEVCQCTTRFRDAEFMA